MEHVKMRAWEFLLQHHLKKLPLDLLGLGKGMYQFQIVSYSDGWDIIAAIGKEEYANQHAGFTLAFHTASGKQETIIFYKDTLSFSTRNYVIAHELGHIVLEHTASNQILGIAKEGSITNEQEQEADAFALALLAPYPLLVAMQIYSPMQISRLTGLSLEKSELAAIEVIREEGISKNALIDKLLYQFHTVIETYQVTNQTAICSKTRFQSEQAIQAAAAFFLETKRKMVAGTAFLILGISLFVFVIAITTPEPKTKPALHYIELLPLDESDSTLAKYLPNNAPSEPAIQPPPTIPPESSLQDPSAKLPKEASASSGDVADREQVVVVTRTGEKYHTPSCSYVAERGDTRSMSIEKAISSGFEPCKTCHPDTSSQNKT